ncbi:MAG TPA: AAA family ATPase [Roseiarcus sp.]
MQVLWGDGERVLFRGSWLGPEGERMPVLAVLLAADHPPPLALERLAHEYELREELHDAWAARPLELVREEGRAVLVLEDPGGEPLARLLGKPIEIGVFLRLAIGVAAALGEAHRAGLVHKDLKPGNILVNCGDGAARLTGFGIAIRMPRQRQGPDPPEVIAGTLAYMAPEQTGRMNRSIDSRSDLYALGVIFYEMLTGLLPFRASDPMEWVHCHIARKPVPPDERVGGVPRPISDIVMKLLAKTPEERYQTAAGVAHDLRHSLDQWRRSGRVDPFALGGRDTPDRLIIPEKLYGREREVETLLAAFDRVVATGTPELVLVSGYSGIGKSSVVNELHRTLVPARGMFASGKFDQYKRNIPYATIAQALQSLVQHILASADAEMGRWRTDLLEALGPNGQLMVNLVPELALIIGEQPPVPDLPPQDQQARFQLAFRRLLQVFARPEHPLALFLDDLQWLDSATLDLIDHLVAHSEVRCLLLVAAYRDNEVGAAHPLTRKLETLRASGTKISDIKLGNLDHEQLGRLIADTLGDEPDRVAPLAQLAHAKTAGNPFFVLQFLHALADEELLAYDHAKLNWSWDLDRIHAKGYTDNVVDILVAKLARLPHETQEALQRLACLGNAADVTSLAIVLGTSEDEVHAALRHAVPLELIEQLPNGYGFVHDRVQEAAYSLIPEDQRAATHLLVGRLLVAKTPPEKREESIFEIVNQLDRGAALIAAPQERERVAELNLMAGKRAKAATAYDVALQYFIAGQSFLPKAEGQELQELAFDLELNRAECDYLIGNLASADERLANLSGRAPTRVHSAAVACLRINLYTTMDRSDRAVAVGLDYLRQVDREWSIHPTADDVRRDYARLWRRLGSSAIEGLVDRPRMKDPDYRAIMDVLTVLTSPALFTDLNLFRLIVSRMVALSLDHGNADGSCLAYAWLGGVLGTYFDEYAAGLRFGRLALDLVDKQGLDRFKARVYLVFAVHVAHWTQPLEVSRAFLRRAFEAAISAGDLSYAAYSCIDLITNRIASGDLLGEVEQEADKGLEFAGRTRFGLAADCITGQLKLVRMLRGLTLDFGSLNDADFDEGRFIQRLEDNPQLAIGACWYWIRKLQASVYSGDDPSAVVAVSKVASWLWTAPTQFELAEYHFYAALARAFHCHSIPEEERPAHLATLAAHHKQLAVWAENGPATFANRAALIGAEIAALEGRHMDAMRLYEEAIGAARIQGFIQNEALAHERAARFFAALGLHTSADAHLRNSRRCYLSWGADGKVRRLDKLYPQLAQNERSPEPTSTIGARVESLDLATVLKVSQAVSGETDPEALIETLMRMAIEQAGAERGLLILPAGPDRRIAAEAAAIGDTIAVERRDEAATAAALPESILHYVLHTQETVVLDDAAARNPFSADPYLLERNARSVLCLPLTNQGKSIGMLYLENNLAPHVFAPARIAALKLLASQAAIALENARLYKNLADRESKIRRLVDANIVGIFIWNFEGRILEANDAFLRMIGYEREDLGAGRLSWRTLTPPNWLDRHEREWIPELRRTGIVRPYEKEYFRKDGSRAPVLVGGAIFEEGGEEGVAFVLDLTERNRAAGAMREMQIQLEHANRVATLGQLTTSIAHEVSQPITASVVNAEAALRWLDRPQPALEEARQALGRVVRDGGRASVVIRRARDLIKKAPERKDRVDANAAIREVIELTRSEALKNRVSVKAELADDLPTIDGDRVELQQVILNLIVNAIEAMGDMDEGPRDLRIATEKTETGDLLVSVLDSGPGLAPAIRDNLFQAFQTTKPNGLGLGLSICRSIIEAHSGRLWASANVPRGAVFQFTLPAQDGAAAAVR